MTTIRLTPSGCLALDLAETATTPASECTLQTRFKEALGELHATGQ
jgi:hypothetical protein